MNWFVREEGFDTEKIPAQGNRFLIGNGYLGIRGSLDEYTKTQRCAVNLAGIYDRVGDGWREPVNAPNGLYLLVCADEVSCALPGTMPQTHAMWLDFQHAVLHRETSWSLPAGTLTLYAERFASMPDAHRILAKTTLSVTAPMALAVTVGIDGDVWDIYGPHFDAFDMDTQGDTLQMQGDTHEKGIPVTVQNRITTDFEAARELQKTERTLCYVYRFLAQPGQTYTLIREILVRTGADEPEEGSKTPETSWDEAFQEHCAAWEKKWESALVTIEGDEEAMRALNYSSYHLMCIAPRPGSRRSIPARGLSGQTYKGAIFWDTEMFMLDFFLFTDPEAAKSLIRYRIDTLPGAMEKARQYGWDGAFYAWESQEGGYDACTDYNVTDVFSGRPMRTYFRDKQVHISAAVVYGLMRYQEVTGDRSLLAEGALAMVTECARFYRSLLLHRATHDMWEIHDVIGPDEYHERINNNAYTNRMASYVLQTAAELLKEVCAQDASRMDAGLARQIDRLGGKEACKALAETFTQAASHMYLQQPGKDGVIRQFDGYDRLEDATLAEVKGRLKDPREYWGGAYGVASETKIIKQADVVTMLNLFPEDYSEDILKQNWLYYEPRTEHGSSLSACMYAMLACRCHMSDAAMPFFLKSARADLDGGGKEWAGLVYIGGTHPAAAGGAYMTAVEGFGGLSLRGGDETIRPALPTGWKKMSYRVWKRGEQIAVTVTEQGVKSVPLK